MSLVKYGIFNKVAELESFTKAGETLGLTQSAVSHAILSLEREFGFSLVHRGKNGIKLTSEGYIMLSQIRQVLQAQEMLNQEAANILGVTKGIVRIGTFSSISSKWLPNIIQVMDLKFPGITIELREGDYYEIEQWLLSGEIDCGFLNQTNSKQFQFFPLVKDQLLCIVSNKSSLYDKKSVNIKDVEVEPFIFASYNGTHDVMTTFERYNVKPSIRFELYDEKGIVSMIAHGLGITILPQLVLDQLPENVRGIPINEESFRVIGLSVKRQISPATQRFVEVVKKWVNDNNDLNVDSTIII